jgi:hypothetical protein
MLARRGIWTHLPLTDRAIYVRGGEDMKIIALGVVWIIACYLSYRVITMVHGNRMEQRMPISKVLFVPALTATLVVAFLGVLVPEVNINIFSSILRR